MSLLTPTDFITKWLARFADNTIGAINEATMREFALDLNDSALAGKLDKTKTTVTDWAAYTGTGKVGGLGPNGIFVMGDAITQNDPAIDRVLTSFDVQTYEAGHKQYKRWITRNQALTILEDTGWVEVGEGGGVETVNGIEPDENGNVTVAAKNLLIGYADDANGTNPSTDPTGKKYRAEYIPADDDPAPTTFTPALAAGKWVPFSNNKLQGEQTGAAIDLNIDFLKRPAFTGNVNITEFQNVYLGARTSLELKSLFNAYSPVSGTATIAVASTTVNGTGTAFQTDFAIGDIITIGGVDRIVSSIQSQTQLTVTTSAAATQTDAVITKRVVDTLTGIIVFDSNGTTTTAARINGVDNVLIKVFQKGGAFVPGVDNDVFIECVSVPVSSVGNYAFNVWINPVLI